MKKIPDLRLKGDGVAGLHHPFTFDSARLLAEQFEFFSCYPLRDKLNEAADSYYLWNNADKLPASSTQRDFLEELERRAKALEEALIKLGGFTYELSNGVDLGRMKCELHRLAINANVAGSQLSNDPPGRDKDVVFHKLLKALRYIYTEGTGRHDKLTRDSINECYKGHFYSFVCECSRIIRVDKSETAIGRAISKVIT